MTAYTIINRTSGVTLGTYEGESEWDALEAMARDAGYDSFGEVAGVLGKTEDDASDELIVEAT